MKTVSMDTRADQLQDDMIGRILFYDDSKTRKRRREIIAAVIRNSSYVRVETNTGRIIVLAPDVMVAVEH
ncbi:MULTISPECIES: hypothetical protein [Nocardia]|uniref:hypothetical protein n=1 Tax=Nocardia TaxID=1817 RepID=UPI000D69D4A3|nr:MULTISPECIES: hypothetical protein [Nocardia]